MKRQAFVALRMLVRAHVFVARAPDERGPGDELRGFAAGDVAEGAPSHVGDGIAAMDFGERRVRRSGRAAVVVNRDRSALQYRRRRHSMDFTGRRTRTLGVPFDKSVTVLRDNR